MNQDYITVYDNVITPNICDDFVKFFEDNKSHSFKEKEDWRSFQELNLGEFPNILNQVEDIFQPCIKRYQKDNNISDLIWPYAHEFEVSNIKKYLPNDDDRFDLHADSNSTGTMSRFLSMFIYLTDNDSGHTSFPDRDIRIQPKKGRLLMFPPNWCYPHAGEKVTDKSKYILSSYCHYTA